MLSLLPWTVQSYTWRFPFFSLLRSPFFRTRNELSPLFFNLLNKLNIIFNLNLKKTDRQIIFDIFHKDYAQITNGGCTLKRKEGTNENMRLLFGSSQGFDSGIHQFSVKVHEKSRAMGIGICGTN